MKLIIIFIIIILLYFYYQYTNTIINFYSPSKINNILKNDNYSYFLNMNETNLELRNINNKNDFLKTIEYNFHNFSVIDKFILKFHIYKAHNIINKIMFPGFIGRKLKKIPWLIACSNSKKYEFGFPHTHNNIIILNIDNLYNKNLFKTLIHERIHIYQKLFPNDISDFLNEYNFKKEYKQNQFDRVNPDTDDYIYSKDNIIYECKIKDNKVNCTNNSSIYEHPYEYMAYLIVNQIL